MLRLLGTIILIGLFADSAFAQDSPQPRDRGRNFKIIPAVGPTFSPELGLTLAGAAAISFSIHPSDSLLNRSTVNSAFLISTRGAVVLSSTLASYWFEDRMRIEGLFWIRDIPDHYWGVGFDNADTIEESDSTTAYDRFDWKINPQFYGRVAHDLYVGLNIDVNFTRVRNPNPVMQADPDFIEFGPDNFQSGLGGILRIDSRDLPANAYRGVLLQILHASYLPALGSENSYHVVDAEYRHYVQINRPGRTLAWTTRSRISIGSTPYPELSQIGSARDLRGYRQGQFRDKIMVYGIVEYRHMLKHIFQDATENKFGAPHSRHGLVAWAGVGSIGKDNEDSLRLLPNFGVGYRFEAVERMNARIDIGFGRGRIGFYVDFSEAF